MRIYNATDSQMNLPFPGGNVSIAPHSESGNLGANTATISMLVSAYTTDEIAFIVSGPFELNLCSSIPTVVSYVVQSVEEAIERLEPKKAVKNESENLGEAKTFSAGPVKEAAPKKEAKKPAKPVSKAVVEPEPEVHPKESAPVMEEAPDVPYMAPDTFEDFKESDSDEKCNEEPAEDWAANDSADYNNQAAPEE